MHDKLMYIPNDDAQNYAFCRLQLLVEKFEHSTNQNSIIDPKIVEPTNKKSKTVLLNFGD